MLTRMTCNTHEGLYRVEDAASGLRGFIALHSTARGPAAGGLRMRPYASEEEAIEDVLRLSRGMSFKNAAADLPLGGGKAVIMGDPARDKSEALLRAFGRAVGALEGRYWTAEDMGMSPADMAVLRQEAPYVAGLDDGPHASGDPSPVTARGIFNAMRCAAGHRFGKADVAGLRVAVQGLGHVGMYLAEFLHEAGAKLTVCDPDAARVRTAVERFGAEAVTTETIYDVRADVFAPCAIGGILDAQTIPRLQVKMVVGGANNQLATEADAARLHARQILYAPDYVANGGGIINVATEILRISDRQGYVARKLGALEATMDRILARAAREDVSPAEVADAEVETLVTAQAA